MSERKPNMNKTFGQDQTFFTQKKNTAQIEYRPTIRRPSLKSENAGVDSSERMVQRKKSGSKQALRNESQKTTAMSQQTAEPKSKTPKYTSMREHLQRFNKQMLDRPFQASASIATDGSFFEKLAHHKRTNVTYSNFAKSRGRDNSMYHLSDGYNLNKREDDTFMDQCIALRLAQKEHAYRNLQDKVTRDAQENAGRAMENAKS